MGFDLSVIVLLTLLNGFFSGAEIAILSVRKTRLKELSQHGNRAARAVLRLRHNPERFLATVQVGITVVGATAAAFGGSTLEEPLTAWLEARGAGSAAGELALVMVVALVSSLSIVIGELVPKSLALRSAETTSLFVGPPLELLSSVARPIVWALTRASNLVLSIFRDETTFSETRLSKEELQQLVEEAAESGSLHPGAGAIASRAIDLAELPVAALTIPRHLVTTLRVDGGRDEVWPVIKARPHSRYPVVERDLDSVCGYVTSRELIHQIVEEGVIDLSAILREIPVYFEKKPAVEVLRALQASSTQIALIVDDHGMPSGIVTIEDIAEELLGEILEEHEELPEWIRAEAKERVLVRADALVHELNRELDLDLPESSDYATLGGLLMHMSGCILQKGQRMRLAGNVEAEVVEATKRQVKRVRLHLPPIEDEH
jgi:putative hemolysin